MRNMWKIGGTSKGIAFNIIQHNIVLHYGIGHVFGVNK